jgi:hypothetical protein
METEAKSIPLTHIWNTTIEALYSNVNNKWWESRGGSRGRTPPPPKIGKNIILYEISVSQWIFYSLRTVYMWTTVIPFSAAILFLP